MSSSWKTICMTLAGCHDAWRLTPRLLLFAACWFVYDMYHELFAWYTALPAAERTMEASGLAWGMFTTISGFVTVFLNAYVKSGRKWSVEAVDDAKTG